MVEVSDNRYAACRRQDRASSCIHTRTRRATEPLHDAVVSKSSGQSIEFVIVAASFKYLCGKIESIASYRQCWILIYSFNPNDNISMQSVWEVTQPHPWYYRVDQLNALHFKFSRPSYLFETRIRIQARGFTSLHALAFLCTQKCNLMRKLRVESVFDFYRLGIHKKYVRRIFYGLRCLTTGIAGEPIGIRFAISLCHPGEDFGIWSFTF